MLKLELPFCTFQLNFFCEDSKHSDIISKIVSYSSVKVYDTIFQSTLDITVSLNQTRAFSGFYDPCSKYGQYNYGFSINKENPLNELIPFAHIIISVLSQELPLNGIGMNLHASAVNIHQNGIIAPGRSGSGKSTLYQLHAKEKRISDETTIIFKHENQWCVYSLLESVFYNTPSIIPIRAFLLLKHADENHLEQLDSKKLAPHIMKNIQVFGIKEKIFQNDSLFSLAYEIAESVPFYEFGFNLKNPQQYLEDFFYVDPIK